MSRAVAPALSPTELAAAVATQRRFALQDAPTEELIAEAEERFRWLASYQADLHQPDLDPERQLALAGGVAFERHQIDAIASELERRTRARPYGYRSAVGAGLADLRERFRLLRAGGAAALAALIAQETGQPGRQHGGRWWFRCPFHPDTTPSLVVYPDGIGHCFGCRWHGDAAAFLADLRGIRPIEALRLLEAGVV